MNIKLFGKNIFEFNSKSRGQLWIEGASSETKKSKYIPDFYTSNNDESLPMELVATTSTGAIYGPGKKKKDKVEPKKPKVTPKSVYEMQMLHDKTFKINTDPKYIDKQLESFRDKLGLISAEEYDMRRGVEEISSVLMRLENRKKYPETGKLFEDYAYTTTTKINEVVNRYDNLKLGKIAQFIADMPKEAVAIMKEYNKSTHKLCEKQAVFYIIADKKDFKKTNGRRDPILLVQSPFGHFWQILGAWDKEMLFLEEL